LWRGSRDGFGASVFHRQCEGHANTLTVIRDTDGNIFGGFTPLTWESTSEVVAKADGSLRSFIFTLKNPHHVAGRKFVLKVEKKDHAIECCAADGPRFWDINIWDNCNVNGESATYFGRPDSTYTNDTGLDGKTFLTPSEKFQVDEIEVFEISP
jgi:hypothetical protein